MNLSTSAGLCTGREGADGSHCDHQTSPQQHPMIPHTKQFTCCHCGRVREEAHQPSVGGQTYTAKKHGPYVKETYVIY